MKNKKIKITIASVVVVILLTLLLSECVKRGNVCVGSTNSTESIILGELFSQLIEEKTDLAVTRKLNLGTDDDCFAAMQAGEIDVYPEYTGTALIQRLKLATIANPDEAYLVVSKEFSEQFHMTWLDTIGFDNSLAIAVAADVCQQYELGTISGLAALRKSFVFGAEPEFFEQEDGFDDLCACYGIEFLGDPQSLNAAQKFAAIGRGDLDAVVVRITDAQIRLNNLKLLVDDKGFFPPCFAAPVVRSEVLGQYPQLGAALNALSGKLDDAAMTDLNYQVGVEGQDVKDVVHAFLKEQGLI